MLVAKQKTGDQSIMLGGVAGDQHNQYGPQDRIPFWDLVEVTGFTSVSSSEFREGPRCGMGSSDRWIADA